MASTTANLQKMKQSATELENISASLASNYSKLSEVMENLRTKWQGDAATKYIQSFNSYSPELERIAVVIDQAATNLRTVDTAYTKAETSAADAINSLLKK